MKKKTGALLILFILLSGCFWGQPDVYAAPTNGTVQINLYAVPIGETGQKNDTYWLYTELIQEDGSRYCTSECQVTATIWQKEGEEAHELPTAQLDEGYYLTNIAKLNKYPWVIQIDAMENGQSIGSYYGSVADHILPWPTLTESKWKDSYSNSDKKGIKTKQIFTNWDDMELFHRLFLCSAEADEPSSNMHINQGKGEAVYELEVDGAESNTVLITFEGILNGRKDHDNDFANYSYKVDVKGPGYLIPGVVMVCIAGILLALSIVYIMKGEEEKVNNDNKIRKAAEILVVLIACSMMAVWMKYIPILAESWNNIISKENITGALFRGISWLQHLNEQFLIIEGPLALLGLCFPKKVNSIYLKIQKMSGAITLGTASEVERYKTYEFVRKISPDKEKIWEQDEVAHNSADKELILEDKKVGIRIGDNRQPAFLGHSTWTKGENDTYYKQSSMRLQIPMGEKTVPMIEGLVKDINGCWKKVSLKDQLWYLVLQDGKATTSVYFTLERINNNGWTAKLYPDSQSYEISDLNVKDFVMKSADPRACPTRITVTFIDKDGNDHERSIGQENRIYRMDYPYRNADNVTINDLEKYSGCMPGIVLALFGRRGSGKTSWVSALTQHRVNMKIKKVIDCFYFGEKPMSPEVIKTQLENSKCVLLPVGTQDTIKAMVYVLDLAGEELEQDDARISSILDISDMVVTFVDDEMLWNSGDMKESLNRLITAKLQLDNPDRLRYVHIGTKSDLVKEKLAENPVSFEQQDGPMLTDKSMVFKSVADHLGNPRKNCLKHMAIAKEILNEVQILTDDRCFLISSGKADGNMIDFSSEVNAELPFAYIMSELLGYPMKED